MFQRELIAWIFCISIKYAVPCLSTTRFDNARDVNLQSVLGGNVRLDTAMKSKNNSQIRTAQDLKCYDWSDKCRWRNEIGSDKATRVDELEWSRANGRPDPAKMRAISGTAEVPGTSDGKFLITGTPKFRNYNDAAMLISDLIPCQKDDGIIRFKYWTSPGTEIKVCRRRPNSGKSFEYCSPPIISGDPGPAIAAIPGPVPYPFEIVIMASGFTYNQGGISGGMVIVDDLEYDATICDNKGVINPDITQVKPLLLWKTTPPQVGIGIGSSAVPEDQAACRAVSCSFDVGKCVSNFLQNGWKTASGPVGNFHTGIRSSFKGSFGYGSGPPTELVLRTSSFELSAPRMLTFCYYRAAVDAQLVISSLSEGIPNTLYASPVLNISQDHHKWVCDQTFIPQGKSNGLQFDVRNLKNQFAYFGIDEILLTDGKSPLCNSQ